MVPTRWRALLGASVVLVSVALLTSCWERSPQGSFSISVDSDELLVANCGDDIAAPFDVFISELAYPDSWTVLDGKSSTEWLAGELRPATPAEWSSVRETNEIDGSPGHQINVFFQNEESSARSTFSVPDGGMDAGMWLHQDGTVSRSPCGE